MVFLFIKICGKKLILFPIRSKNNKLPLWNESDAR